jgi:hypothetical protein
LGGGGVKVGRRKVGNMEEFDAMKKMLFGCEELSQEGFIPRLTKDIYGNGKKGLIDRVSKLEWMVWPIYGGIFALLIMVGKMMIWGIK